jgi:hypothetical protein
MKRPDSPDLIIFIIVIDINQALFFLAASLRQRELTVLNAEVEVACVSNMGVQLYVFYR